MVLQPFLTSSRRAIVIDNVEKSADALESSVCVAYIYIRYSDESGLKIRHYLEVLVKQTVEKHAVCRKLAEHTYTEHMHLKTQPTEAELLQLLKSFASLVKAFYFLDALDEAPEDVQVGLVEKLSSTGAKLFITSRPSKVLEERFPSARRFTIVAHPSDLDLLINSRLSTSQRLIKVLEQGGATLRADIVASVKQKCGGM
jgi:ankyrin repeat domain-containing protein 50